jgi:hypothetical protein
LKILEGGQERVEFKKRGKRKKGEKKERGERRKIDTKLINHN